MDDRRVGRVLREVRIRRVGGIRYLDLSATAVAAGIASRVRR